jgi:hypothetical protein
MTSLGFVRVVCAPGVGKGWLAAEVAPCAANPAPVVGRSPHSTDQRPYSIQQRGP